MSMGERYFFSKLITKDLTAIDSQRRLFEGVLTVEIKDRQGEITIRDELMKVLPIWIARGGPITDTHSNRVVGQGINYSAMCVTDSDGTVYPAITIQGEIFKDYELDDEIWEAIKSGRYKGLSFGGATKSNRTPVVEKDGTIAYSLKDLEQYEVAVCEEPAVPLALITQHNALAKAFINKSTSRGNGMVCIRCDKVKCYVDKSEDVIKNGEAFSDVQGPNEPYKDEQGAAFKKDKEKEKEKSSYGDMKHLQDNPKSEELEADQAQMCQDNSATYRGVAGKAHTESCSLKRGEAKISVGVDHPEDSNKLKDEKAMDQDNKELLEDAGLEEEKKLEHADGHPDGPERKNKILPLVAGVAGKVISEGAKVATEGAKLGTAEALCTEPEESCKSIQKPKIGRKKPYTESETEGINPKKEHMEHGNVNDAAMLYHEATHYDPKTAEKWKATIDILNMDLKLKKLSSEVANPGGSKYTQTNEEGEKTDTYGNKMPKVMGKKPGKDIDEKGTRGGTKAPGFTESLPEFHAREKIPDYKPGSRPDTIDNRNWLSSRARRMGLKKTLEILEITMKLKMGGNSCYNTDEVVREYCDEIDKEKEVIGEKKALTLHMIDDKGQHWYECNETNKTVVDVGAWTEPARGGFAGREPGITRDDESRSIHDVNQPKHVNKPYDDEKAEALKKEDDYKLKITIDEEKLKKNAGDPQLAANNAEDGVNRKMRLDNDPDAEAFEKSIPKSRVGNISDLSTSLAQRALNSDPATDKDTDRYERSEGMSIDDKVAENLKAININDQGHGSGGIRSGASYDNAQQDTGIKDNPRKVIMVEYEGMTDNENGADNEKFNKATIIINMLNDGLKKQHNN